MDSFEWNKIIGAILGTLLFVVVVKTGTEAFFETAPPAKPGYVVQGVVENTSTASAAPVEEAIPDWGTVLPTADTAKGKDISHKCEQCHDLSKGGPNKIGPNLWAIVGAQRGTDRGGFDFSAAMKAKGGTWTFDELFKFLKSPGAYIPGTKMTFAGLPSAKDRIDLIAWLRTQADSPTAIPAPNPAKANAPTGAAANKPNSPAAANATPSKTPATPNGASTPAAPQNVPPATAPSTTKAPAPAAPAATPAPKK
ncbi:MAG: c-type cytochrome [Rhizomicrobium sp.]|jgi:cytochrome c